MPNYSSGSPEIESRHNDAEGQPGRPGPRRRGRRGGRRRSNRTENSASSSGVTGTPVSVDAADENAVSQQLRMLMSPQLVRGQSKSHPTEALDPQLTYRPPATIESFGAKSAEAPVSAASFKKSESPLQAVVATVGSMAILAALYHFGYYEGSQTPPQSQQYAASIPVSVTPALLPDPFPSEPAPEMSDAPVAASASRVLETVAPPRPPEVPPLTPKPTPVPARQSVPATPSGLYLQVAALQDVAAARDLNSELRAAGFETEILKPSDDGLIRVISGPYSKRDQARTAARKMSGWGVQPFLREF
jgi:cell division septation protein DedD